MSEPDPFTGAWTFQPAKSTMNAPGVQRWVQCIEVKDGTIRVREDVLSSSGKHAAVNLEAQFDGRDYPVAGSSLADAIAYQRPDSRTITGTGKKNGSVTVRETITVSSDGTSMRLTFSILSDNKEVANGVAVFDRTNYVNAILVIKDLATVRDN